MSLSKQLLILISALFLMIFTVNFILSVNNIKSYLEGEAEVHAQDTATSLGLSLSPFMINETDPVIETTMKAIFDMGYYQEIKLVNVDEEVLLSLTNKQTFEGVPSWFVNIISIKGASAKSEISSGWNISGIVYVTINQGYAYVKLYEQAKSSFYYSLLALVVSVFLLLVVLRITLSSLKKIDLMALKIADGKFETIDQSPWTTEIKNVTVSMNLMSRKIEGAINSLNVKLGLVGRQLQLDDLTGLKKQCVFETDMKTLFSADNNDIFVFIIKIDGLNDLVKELSDESINLFLKDFAQVLTDAAAQNQQNEVFVYRFYGSEFALLAKKITLQQTKQLAKQLGDSFAKVGAAYNKLDIAHIGIVPFNTIGTTDSMLLAANEAYEQAMLIGANSFYIRTNDNQAKDIAEWKSLVFSVVATEAYKVSFISPVESFDSKKILMVDSFTQAFDEQNNLLSIGTFVSIAEKFEKIVSLDKSVTLRVIDYINREKIEHAVAINLSIRTIKNSHFRDWLRQKIKLNPSISHQLVFSLSAYSVAKNVTVFKEFIDFVHLLNAKVMIKRFETQTMSSELAKELKPDYIRLARALGNDIVTDERKKLFVETVQDIGKLLDISILAENVIEDIDYECLKAVGIAGASR